MGNCYSSKNKKEILCQTTSGPSHCPPLPPPAQDLVDDLLNRWRHGEVTFLLQAFRNARKKQEMQLSLPKEEPKNCRTSVRTDRSNFIGKISFRGKSRIGGNGGGCAAPRENNHIEKDGGRPISMRNQSNDAGSATMVTGSVNHSFSEDLSVSSSAHRKPRNHLTDVGFGMLFLSLKAMPIEAHANAFLCFCSNGSGGISFRDLLRGLALCCRGNRVERLKFLLGVFSSSKNKYIGAGEDGSTENDTIVLTTDESCSLLQWLSSVGVNGVDSENLDVPASSVPATAAVPLSKTVKKRSFGEIPCDLLHSIPGEGVTLGQYFAWAELYLSNEALDNALSPFNILPTPVQERERAVELLPGFVLTPEERLFAVSIQWWKEWAAYCHLKESAHLMNDHVKALGLVNDIGWQQSSAVGLSDGLSYSHSLPPSRPHEIDNSPLQGHLEWELKCNLRTHKDFVFVLEKLWKELFFLYGGGPAFPRTVVSLCEGHPIPLSSPFCDSVLICSSFVDPYPWGLYVCTCTVSGHPSARSRLVLCSPYAIAHSIARQILAEFGASNSVIFRLWILAENSTVLSTEHEQSANCPQKQCHFECWKLLSDDEMNLNLMALGLGQLPLGRRKLLMETQVKQVTEHQQQLNQCQLQ